MEESTSREKILKNIRDALIEKSELPYPIVDMEAGVYEEMTEPLDVTFAEELVKAAGKFVYCESEDEFLTILQSFILDKNWPLLYCTDPLLQGVLKQGGIPYQDQPEAITEAGIGITRCECFVARLGSIMVSSRLSPGRKIIAYPEIHLVVGTTSQLVPDLKQAIQHLRKKYNENLPSLVSFITGPSRTADIEKTLVMGAHGPRELYVFLIDDTATSND